MSSYLPLFLKQDPTKPAIVIGGGEIGAAKLEALRSTGMPVMVVTKELAPATRELLHNTETPYTLDSYKPGYLVGAALVVAATDNDALNAQIAADAREAGILVNVVDNPPLCDFIFPALIKRGPLQVAISSAGISPVLARVLKQQIEQLLPANLEKLIDFLNAKKQAVRGKLKHLQPRRLFWEKFLNSPAVEEVLEGNELSAERLFKQALDVEQDETQAGLYLVGVGPGHPELLTVKAIRLISQADVLLYDRLIAPDLLSRFARKDAVKMSVGKTKAYHFKSQAQIEEMIAEKLQEGLKVVRVKGGDPGIFAHGAGEISIAKRLGVPYQVVPGVSAANGCAAYAGFPLTERGGTTAVRYVTLYDQSFEDGQKEGSLWESLRNATNETLVLYMSTKQQIPLCDKLISLGFDAETPVIAIEQGTTPNQRSYPATLATFGEKYSEHQFASPTIFMVGQVARWQEDHQWKEERTAGEPYFAPLKKVGVDPAAANVNAVPAEVRHA